MTEQTAPGLLSEAEMMAKTSSVKPDTGPAPVDELDVLFPQKRTWTVNGEEVIIKEFTFGQLPKAIKLVKGVGGLFAFYQSQGTLNTAEAIMHIVSEGGEDLIELLAFNLGKPREWFDGVPSDAGVEILVNFMLVNVSFFTSRVIPLLTGTLKSNSPGL
jgi:hypothetical protein